MFKSRQILNSFNNSVFTSICNIINEDVEFAQTAEVMTRVCLCRRPAEITQGAKDVCMLMTSYENTPTLTDCAEL